MTLFPEGRVYASKTDMEMLCGKWLAGRKAEMEQMTNHHVFVGKKLVRAKWLYDDRGDKARERPTAMQRNAMTLPLKVARMLERRLG